MIYITSLQIDPNPVQTGEIIEVEIEIKEVYKDSKRYPGKYGYRYVVPLAGTWIEIEQMDMDAVNEKRRSLCGNVKLSTCILENGKICLRNFERCTTIK